MRHHPRSHPGPIRRLAASAAVPFLLAGGTGSAAAGGVTVITHGFLGNVTDWIIPMADRVPGHPGFPGSDYTCYTVSVTAAGTSASRIGGVEPTASASGEILIKLDWSALAGLFGGESSTFVAEAAAEALLATDLIPELGGRALAEMPLHLAGHSRGGSVVTELARFLGAEGVWVDHVTTMDPRPVVEFGDAAVATWSNVLFADNYWQNLGNGLTVPNGQPIDGAYNRQLTVLGGGYSSSHSDAHLWYHGTIELGTPATDSMADITAAERASWWTAGEAAGAATGYLLSRIGGGDRTSAVEPAGDGTGMIRDGLNQRWDFGAGTSDNRTDLPANSGAWPNLIVAEPGTGGLGGAGEPVRLRLRHQSGASASGEAELRILLDPDRNPWNGNELEIDRRMVANTGTAAVAETELTIALDGAGAPPPGTWAVAAELASDGRRRHLYLAPTVTTGSSAPPPTIDPDSVVVTATEVRFDVLAMAGQEVAVEASIDLVDWTRLATRVFPDSVWAFIDSDRADFDRRFYRAVLVE